MGPVGITFVVFLGVLTTVTSFGVGVPPLPTICKTMTPGHHGEKSQSTPPPCNVTASNYVVKNGDKIEVVLSMINGEDQMKGFYLQARDSLTSKPIGSFMTSGADVKFHSCGGVKNNAAHHSNPNGKKSINVSWKAPPNYSGSVLFTATCLQDFFKFWTQVKSDPVTVQK